MLPLLSVVLAPAQYAAQYAAPEGLLILTASIVAAALIFIWGVCNPPSTRR